MKTSRIDHTATLLKDESVLITGGTNRRGVVASAEIYKISTGQWVTTTSNYWASVDHTATLLNDGDVLVTGGRLADGTLTNNAAIYSPKTKIWTTMKSMRYGRANHTATLLLNGKVLVSGGGQASAELFDPITRLWTDAGDLRFTRTDATATLLPDGKVLVVGGSEPIQTSPSALDSAEVYDPDTNTWFASTHLNQARSGHATVLLLDKTVLVMGGIHTAPLKSVERTGPLSPQLETTCTAVPLVILENDTCTTTLTFSKVNPSSPQFSTTSTSSNETLVPNTNIVVGGSSAARTLTIRPATTNAQGMPTRQGDTLITIKASDGVQTETITYPVTIIPPPWLVMLYLNGDDGPLGGAEERHSMSIAPSIKTLLQELASIPFNPAMRLVILSDTHDSYGDSRIYVRDPDGLNDVTQDLRANQSHWPGFTPELNSADPTTLRSFVNWARQIYSGSTYSFLSLVDHGGGWAPEFTNNASQPRGIRIRQAGGWRGMSIDYTNNGDSMSTKETHLALEYLGIDVLFFDACLMAMLESIYEIRNDTDFLIAGQNILFAEFPYRDYLSQQNLKPSTNPRDLTITIARNYNKDINATQNPFTIAAIDLTKLRATDSANVAQLVDALATTILAELPTGTDPISVANPTLQALQSAYSNALKFDYDSSLTLDPNEGYVDLRDFTNQLINSHTLPTAVKDAAFNLKVAIQGQGKTVIEVYHQEGSYLGRPMDFSRSNGLSIYLPLGEQDYRPTLVNPDDPNCPAKPERQLTYYADPAQLAFTKDYPQWAKLLVRLESNVPIRRAPFPPGCAATQAAQSIAAPTIDGRQFTSPSQLMTIRQTVYVPVVIR